MTSVWVSHGDSDDYYGIAQINGVYASREAAVAGLYDGYTDDEED